MSKLPWDSVRRLRAAEHYLDRQIDKASETIASNDSLAAAFRRGRTARHRRWAEFVSYARPINEARQHIEWERVQLEHQVDDEITKAVRSLRRR